MRSSIPASTIAIFGLDATSLTPIAARLRGAGWHTVTVTTLDDLLSPPQLLIICDSAPASFVAYVRNVPGWAQVPVLACLPDPSGSAGTDALLAGATDLIAERDVQAVWVARCRQLLRGAAPSDGVDAGVFASSLMRVSELLTQPGDEYAALLETLTVIASALRFERASLVAHVPGSELVFVVAATDAPMHARFAVSIHNYPEIALAMRTQAPVLIDDVLNDARTEAVRERLMGRNVRGAAVFPVLWRGRALGVLLLRRTLAGVDHIDGRGTELAQLIASITAAHLRHGAILESLRDQAHTLSRASYEAERRLRGIDSLREHFESGSDGVVVLDEGGRILFVNQAAEMMTGVARDGLLGAPLSELIPDDKRGLIAAALHQVLRGINLEPFDLPILSKDGEPVWVSVSTSTVLSSSGAVIFVWRDVSAERALAHELGATKEFLERLIDSTVDAIVAADLAGTVILYNQGAERLFGYAAGEVIGVMHVSALYEEGVAQQIMRMLRSTSYGGVGRLEQARRQVRTRNGDMVPVSMTASVVYDGDREVATVGILTDLRERIRIEQRLLDAQQKLQNSERQAMVAELAGAAAHELNQPLTSIIGYAQLVLRQSAADAGHVRGVNVILAEAERMAAIVRKIGKITKYETTNYVGSARIFDLDKAAEDSNAGIRATGASLSAKVLSSNESAQLAIVPSSAQRLGALTQEPERESPSRPNEDEPDREPTRRMQAVRLQDVPAGLAIDVRVTDEGSHSVAGGESLRTRASSAVEEFETDAISNEFASLATLAKPKP